MGVTKNNKEKIAELVKDMLNKSHETMVDKINKALNSGAVDVDEWDESNNPMILPKCILIAILQDEATQYEAKGTSFEKQVKNEVKNIRYFL